MIHIQVTDTDGSVHQLELKENPSSNLMEELTRARLDVPAICGGMAGCGTCHIEIVKGADQLDEMEEDEDFMIESLDNKVDGSRLSCQLPLTKSLDGLEIKVLGDGA
ncbi:MAG: 2Fe-2S iron-sulfur cluster-binding protein [Bacteroidota bacterium]